MKREDFRFADRLRVRWAEVDMQRIVFNGHYLMYFDTAMAGYWRALALPYHETMQRLEGDLFVRKATVEYEDSARYDDLLDVGVRCARIGTSSIVFACGAFRAGEWLVGGDLVYVFADPAARASRPVPPALRAVLEAFETGQPMVDVRVGSWAQLGSDARAIRQAVFVDEQRIPAAMEWDQADAAALHAVAYNRLGMPLATGRLVAQADGIARIGRMAVLAPMRGSRIGSAVLEQLSTAARRRGDVELMLHAQLSAVSFYTRAGFVEHGPAFDEAGIAHVPMRRGA